MSDEYCFDFNGMKVSKAEYDQAQAMPDRLDKNIGEGCIRWMNERGQSHSYGDLPSYRTASFSEWTHSGRWHRLTGPCETTKGVPTRWAIAGVQYATEVDWRDGLKTWELMNEAERAWAIENSRMPKRSSYNDLMWLNDSGQYHTDGKIPAFRAANAANAEQYFEMGKSHRIDGASTILNGRPTAWSIFGVNLSKEEHRLYTEQLKAGKITIEAIHSDTRPGFECRDTADRLHADGVPAVRYANGRSTWCKNGLLHSLDGPASELGTYWIEGRQYKSKSSWKRRANQLKLEAAEADIDGLGDTIKEQIAEIFRKMKVGCSAEKAEKINGTFGFLIDNERWYANIVPGNVWIKKVDTLGPADTLINVPNAKDWIAIATGKMNPTSAFMQGKTKVSGSMAVAIKLSLLLENQIQAAQPVSAATPTPAPAQKVLKIRTNVGYLKIDKPAPAPTPAVESAQLEPAAKKFEPSGRTAAAAVVLSGLFGLLKGKKKVAVAPNLQAQAKAVVVEEVVEAK